MFPTIQRFMIGAMVVVAVAVPIAGQQSQGKAEVDAAQCVRMKWWLGIGAAILIVGVAVIMARRTTKAET